MTVTTNVSTFATPVSIGAVIVEEYLCTHSSCVRRPRTREPRHSRISRFGACTYVCQRNESGKGRLQVHIAIYVFITRQRSAVTIVRCGDDQSESLGLVVLALLGCCCQRCLTLTRAIKTRTHTRNAYRRVKQFYSRAAVTWRGS